MHRRFVEVVIWVAWTDVHWSELPAKYGAWRSVYARFLRWNRRRLWDAIALHIGDEASAHLLQRASDARRRPRTRLPLKPPDRGVGGGDQFYRPTTRGTPGIVASAAPVQSQSRDCLESDRTP